MLKGIHGKPYISLDSYLDVDRLASLHTDIAAGIARSAPRIGVVGPGLQEGQGKDIIAYTRYLYNTLPVSDPARKHIDLTGDPDLAWKFVYWAYGGRNVGWTIYLQIPDTYATKHHKSACRRSQNADYFPSLSRYVETLPFVEYGRIIIFLTEARAAGAIHSDVPPGIEQEPDEFIWMRTRTNKNFFILDSDTQQKHYITGHTAWFDTANYHGTDPGEDASFSIRVDGVFTDDFRARLKESK